jgi:hypothetical protein
MARRPPRPPLPCHFTGRAVIGRRKSLDAHHGVIGKPPTASVSRVGGEQRCHAAGDGGAWPANASGCASSSSAVTRHSGPARIRRWDVDGLDHSHRPVPMIADRKEQWPVCKRCEAKFPDEQWVETEAPTSGVSLRSSDRWTGREGWEISDAAWSVIEPLLPPAGRARGRWRNRRQVLEGIVFKFRTGCPGEVCRNVSGPGRPRTDASPAGPPTALSTSFWPRPRDGRRWTGRSRSTPPSCGPTTHHRQRVLDERGLGRSRGRVTSKTSHVAEGQQHLDGTLEVQLEGGRKLEVDRVVLAMGNLDGRSPLSSGLSGLSPRGTAVATSRRPIQRIWTCPRSRPMPHCSYEAWGWPSWIWSSCSRKGEEASSAGTRPELLCTSRQGASRTSWPPRAGACRPGLAPP